MMKNCIPASASTLWYHCWVWLQIHRYTDIRCNTLKTFSQRGKWNTALKNFTHFLQMICCLIWPDEIPKIGGMVSYYKATVVWQWCEWLSSNILSLISVTVCDFKQGLCPPFSQLKKKKTELFHRFCLPKYHQKSVSCIG